MELTTLAEGYLRAEGYDVIRLGRTLLRGTRQGIAEATDFIFVWIPTNQDLLSFRSRERPYLSDFEKIDSRYPASKKFMLVTTREGLSQDFVRTSRKWYNVEIRVPIQFFDTIFKWDESDAPSAANDLHKRGNDRLRIRTPQPFTTSGTDDPANDLLETLLTKLRSRASGKPIHVVVGPAGIGKTYLSESLFSRLYSSFIEDKRNQNTAWMRPLPLLPEYIQSSSAPTVQALLDAFLLTEFARPLSRSVFEWLLSNQLGVWLIDGLDEIIAGDPGFFDYLLDLMTMSPDFRALPPMVICVRDSLFATHTDLREFCEDYDEYIEVYKLAKWQTPSIRRYARTALGDRADQFLAVLRARQSLSDLASTPYYCGLLVEQFTSGRLERTHSEVALLDDALSSIVQRDYGKGIIDPELMPESDVREFVDELAYQDLRRGFRGIGVDDVRSWCEEWAGLLLDDPKADKERDRFVSQLAQLGLFSQGKMGYIQFSQEILEHFILGLRLVRLFDQTLSINEGVSSRFIRDLSTWQIPFHWITLRVVAEHIREQDTFAELFAYVNQAASDKIAFKNAVQLACLASSDARALAEIPYERHDLSDISFHGLELDGVSFRECDLSNVEFLDCSLRNVDFTDAIIQNTMFVLRDEHSLDGAEVGDLSRFYSMKAVNKEITDHEIARQWFGERTSRRPRTVAPCPAALQLRHLFMKFVRPNGTARRSKLDEQGTLRGKRHYAKPKDVLEAAVRYSYLARDSALHRISRSEGNRYSELVAYVVKFDLKPDIFRLLMDVCDRDGCEHIPRMP